MTSLQTSFAQMPKRSRILFAVSGDAGFTQLKLTNTISAYPNLILSNNGTVLNTTNASTFIENTGYGRSFITGNIFRDLGKELHVQTNGRTDYILSYVQQIKGATTEGVPDNYNVNSTTLGNFWICTWTANNDTATIGVNVVRSG